MNFSYDRAWNDMVAIFRANASLLIVLAGVFVFVPTFARALFIPPIPLKSMDWASLAAANQYFDAYGLPLFFGGLLGWVGQAAMLSILLDRRRPTVAEAITGTLPLLPSIAALNLIVAAAVFGGFLLLIVPGLYLAGRLFLAAPIQMAQRLFNPLSAMGLSFDLTQGNGWRVTGIVFLFGVVGVVLIAAVNAIIGIVLTFVLPRETLGEVMAMVAAFLATATLLVTLILSVAVYRQLEGRMTGN